MKNTPKILICGYGGHGKDTAAEILAKHFDMTFSSSSKFVVEKEADTINQTLGYSCAEEIYANRSKHRPFLYNFIRGYNQSDRARLAIEILTEHDIYVGMRDRQEFEASKNLFDLRIWVDALERLPVEDESSMDISYSEEDFNLLVPNNGTKYQFKVTLITGVTEYLRKISKSVTTEQ